MNTFVIQAGGCGSRMNNLTTTKPKCIVPLFGKPIIFHWFDLYPNDEFLVICDYKKEVLKKFINKFRPNCKVKFIETNKKGTCSGLKTALRFIPNNIPFIFVWSDLLPLEKQNFNYNGINIGLTSEQCSFWCRWKLENKILIEENNIINGVSGLFTFSDKSLISNIPEEGPFTEFLVNTKMDINSFIIKDMIDVGTEEQFRKYHTNNRFFNEVIINENTVSKRAKIKNYEKLINDELDWYEYVKKLGFTRIPKILSKNPFIMSRINGVNPFLKEPSESFFLDVLDTLKTLHSLEETKSDIKEMQIVYNEKTFERVYSVSELIPFFNQKIININSKDCINPFHPEHIEEFKNKISSLYNINVFTLIHGDPTFSNIISCNNKAFLIDPRGYFGKTKLIGDPRYDFAKLYYSFFGNYDNINSKNYFIEVTDDCVFFDIKNHGWSTLEPLFFKNIPYSEKDIKLLHILIWFSLCGYVIEDYSSILLAFYNGVKLYNELS